MIIKRIGFVVVLFFMVAVSNNVAESQEGVPEEHVHHKVGVVHHDVADSSPLITSVISYKIMHFSFGDRVRLHVVYQNISNHDISYVGPVMVNLVLDSNGNLAQETEDGCRRHWFSECYFIQNCDQHFGSRQGKLAPRGKIEADLDLSPEYDLNLPGTYSVVGYISGFNEGPEYFRTNKITITIPPATK